MVDDALVDYILRGAATKRRPDGEDIQP